MGTSDLGTTKRTAAHASEYQFRDRDGDAHEGAAGDAAEKETLHGSAMAVPRRLVQPIANQTLPTCVSRPSTSLAFTRVCTSRSVRVVVIQVY